jgi:hypothetical protein
MLAGIAAKSLRIDHIIFATGYPKAPLNVSSIPDVDEKIVLTAVSPEQPVINTCVLNDQQ